MTVNYLDALIVGAGFGGLYTLRSFQKLGFKCKVVDKYVDLGGTWHANRYPGVMSDSYSWMYRFSEDKEDFTTWPYTRNYLTRDEILHYLNTFVDKHSLRDHLKLSTEVLSAEWDSATQRWRVACSTGQVYVVKFLVTSLGLFGRNKLPDIPGLVEGNFKGKVMHSAAWDRNVDIEGKRVGIIGSGSTGIQLTVAVAPRVRELRSFIRHAQYTVPAGIHHVSPEERQKINDSYDEIRKQIFASNTASGFIEPTRASSSVSPEERDQIYEQLWKLGGGFRFVWGGFSDLSTSVEGNQAACDFMRNKIRQIVQDPAKLDVLLPKEPYARRPPCDDGYYECFNRENVIPVDIQATPITQVEETGIRTADGTLHELDILVLATGFEAVDGPYKAIQDGIKGRDGESLIDHWAEGPSAHMGIFVAGFPNFFIVNGPHVPVANVPTAIEVEITFLTDLLRDKVLNGKSNTVEITPKTEADWIQSCNNDTAGRITQGVSSWTTGKAKSDKPPPNLFFLPGIREYVARAKDLKDNDYPGFIFT
ncbi:cyclohexanone monooxygenase [Dactylonectria estremocensis]|uniref:Cyclohexanone monooxygenase n=1 Tax=Dactylonectria estremocensis TaxID=1079267 RepID=A0A9P9EH74_9HYPO|nr:cyclohexanone monooxygenase [Dactylonectria estremocensis]